MKSIVSWHRDAKNHFEMLLEMVGYQKMIHIRIKFICIYFHHYIDTGQGAVFDMLEKG